MKNVRFECLTISVTMSPCTNAPAEFFELVMRQIVVVCSRKKLCKIFITDFTSVSWLLVTRLIFKKLLLASDEKISEIIITVKEEKKR